MEPISEPEYFEIRVVLLEEREDDQVSGPAAVIDNSTFQVTHEKDPAAGYADMLPKDTSLACPNENDGLTNNTLPQLGVTNRTLPQHGEGRSSIDSPDRCLPTRRSERQRSKPDRYGNVIGH